MRAERVMQTWLIRNQTDFHLEKKKKVVMVVLNTGGRQKPPSHIFTTTLGMEKNVVKSFSGVPQEV